MDSVENNISIRGPIGPVFEYDPGVFHVAGVEVENLRRMMHQQSEQALLQLKTLMEGLLADEAQC